MGSVSEMMEFIETIREDPTNFVSRLVYADWLQEQTTPIECVGIGDVLYCPMCSGTGIINYNHEERAELIRVQCEWMELERERLERKREIRDYWTDTLVRRQEVLNIRQLELIKPIAKLICPDVNNISCEMICGFIQTIQCWAEWWRNNWERVLASPNVVLKSIRFNDWPTGLVDHTTEIKADLDIIYPNHTPHKIKWVFPDEL